jgi:PAS domain S-box-containing protein
VATEQSELEALRRRVAELEQQIRPVQPNGHGRDQQSGFYHAILSSTPDLVYVFDLQHRFTYANQALLTMWGKSWEEAIGKNCLELGYEPWHAAMHDREIEQVIATKQLVRGEVPFTGTHGQRIYDYIFVPVIGTTGHVEAIAGTTRDVTERKLGEAELRESEQRYRTLFNSIDQGFCIIEMKMEPGERLDYRFIEVNKAFGEQSTLLNAEGKWMRELRPGHEEHWFEIYRDVALTGQPIRFQQRGQELEDRWFDVYAFRVGVPEQRRVGVLFTDISERKQAEAQQEFRLTLSDAIRPLRDPEEIKAAASLVLGERLQTNRAFYADVDGDDWVVEGGYAHGVGPLPPGRYAADTYGRRIMESFRAGRRIVVCDARSDLGFTPEEREAQVAIDNLAGLGVPLVKEGQLVAILAVHSAEPRNWTEEEMAAVEDTAERTWAAVERARAETALRQSEERLTFALEAGGGVGTFDWDVPGDRLYMDARSAQLFSVDPELAASGAPLAEFVASIHPDDRPIVSDKVQQACNRGEYAAEYRILQPDGSVRWVFARGRCHKDAAGNPTRFLGVIVDITPQVLARKELERVNKELEEFAYVASHDLQEPLRMVNIYTQMIVKDFCGTDAKAQKYAEFVGQGVTRMETLIRDLLTYSRSVQTDELPVGKADLSAALTEAMSVLKNRIEENSAVIKAESLPVLRGDTAQIAHVFQNLLSNALKYRKNDAPPEIYISANLRDEHCFVCVQDNGIGFDQKYAERIFGLFKRLHKEEYPGTGLGLAICQRIVERYGGRMWAEGTPKQGAKFYFSLPCLKED